MANKPLPCSTKTSALYDGDFIDLTDEPGTSVHKTSSNTYNAAPKGNVNVAINSNKALKTYYIASIQKDVASNLASIDIKPWTSKDKNNCKNPVQRQQAWIRSDIVKAMHSKTFENGGVGVNTDSTVLISKSVLEQWQNEGKLIYLKSNSTKNPLVTSNPPTQTDDVIVIEDGSERNPVILQNIVLPSTTHVQTTKPKKQVPSADSNCIDNSSLVLNNLNSSGQSVPMSVQQSAILWASNLMATSNSAPAITKSTNCNANNGSKLKNHLKDINNSVESGMLWQSNVTLNNNANARPKSITGNNTEHVNISIQSVSMISHPSKNTSLQKDLSSLPVSTNIKPLSKSAIAGAKKQAMNAKIIHVVKASDIIKPHQSTVSLPASNSTALPKTWLMDSLGQILGQVIPQTEEKQTEDFVKSEIVIDDDAVEFVNDSSPEIKFEIVDCNIPENDAEFNIPKSENNFKFNSSTSVVPVDISKILKPDKVSSSASKTKPVKTHIISDRCVRVKPRKSQTDDPLEKGFTKGEIRSKPACIQQLASLIKTEENDIKRLERRIWGRNSANRPHGFESVFVENVESSQNFFPEIKTETNCEEDLPSLQDVISKISNCNITQSCKIASEAGVNPNEALDLIRKGLEMMRGWANQTEKNCQTPGSNNKDSGRPQRNAPKRIHDPSGGEVSSQKRARSLNNKTAVQDNRRTKSLNINKSANDEDLFVIKKVDILNKNHVVVSTSYKSDAKNQTRGGGRGRGRGRGRGAKHC